MQRIRKSGPQGSVRPFQPAPDFGSASSVEEKQLETLEHIAVALSAIDHNFEVLAKNVAKIAKVLEGKATR